MPTKQSDLVIGFIECLHIPEGQHVGKPFKLEPFQKRFIRDIYDNKSGTRHAYLSIGRKNGKSALAAALLLAHIVGPRAVLNSQIVSGARSREQASLVFNLAVKMIELTPALHDVTHIVHSSKRIMGLPMNVEFKAAAADGARIMGISPAFVLLDEVGQVVGPTDYFTDALVSSQGAHENPLLVAISTQAPSDSDMFSVWIDDAIRSKDKHTVCHIHRADEDADLMDKKQWKKANPALGKFLNEKFLTQQMQKAARLPSEETKARNLYLNQRVSLESVWLSPNVWKSNTGLIDEDVFLEKGVHIGLDLSQKFDLTAAVIAAKDDEGVVHVKPYAFTPITGLDERARRDRVPYDTWVRDGLLIGVPGQTIDYEWVSQYLRMQLEDENITVLSINFDRWRIEEFKRAAERKGFAMYSQWTEVGQGYKDQSPRIEAMETALLQHKIRTSNHPVLNMSAANAIAVQDPAGSRKLDKSKGSQKIDPLVAMVMAVYPLIAQTEQVVDIEAMIG